MSDWQKMLEVESDRAIGEAGWTLVEMLVALVLLALMSMMLLNGLAGARKGIEGLQERAGVASVEAVQMHLRGVLGGAWPARQSGTTADAPMIEAGAASLRIVSAYSPAGQYAGLHLVDLVLEPTAIAGRFDLIELRTLYRGAGQVGLPDPERRERPSRLLTNIAGINFRYFGAREESGPRHWGSNWIDPYKLPELIAIDVVYAAGDTRKWPGIITALNTGK